MEPTIFSLSFWNTAAYQLSFTDSTMQAPHSILIYGRDHELLETRRLVLQSAGFQATTVTSLADAEKVAITQSTDLLILCHSLSVEECEKALAMAHSRQHGMKALVLMGTAPVCTLGRDDELMSTFDGPKALIATVTRLLGTILLRDN